MGKHTKLELTWIGKENRPKLELRILIEDLERSYHAPHRVSKNDIFDNILIHGDNLLALKTLEEKFRDNSIFHPMVCKACPHGHEEASLGK